MLQLVVLWKDTRTFEYVFLLVDEFIAVYAFVVTDAAADERNIELNVESCMHILKP